MNKFFKPAEVPTKSELLEMLALQDLLNSRLHADWREQGWNFGLAMLDECMEIQGHLGWKWWKDSASYQVGVVASNLRQIQLEVVDIWHFLMSCGLEEAHYSGRTMEDLADQILGELTECRERVLGYSKTPEALETSLDAYVIQLAHGLTERSEGVRGYIDLASFYGIMCAAGLDAKDLYSTYVGKYALNSLRWSNGYAEGTYLKNWLIPEVSCMYQEDNWYLELILKEFSEHQIQVTVASVLASLEFYYKQFATDPKSLH